MQDPFPDGYYQAVLFGNGDEHIWHDDTVSRPPPPDEGFEADDLLRLEGDERLLVQFELFLDEGEAEVALESQPQHLKLMQGNDKY